MLNKPSDYFIQSIPQQDTHLEELKFWEEKLIERSEELQQSSTLEEFTDKLTMHLFSAIDSDQSHYKDLIINLKNMDGN